MMMTLLVLLATALIIAARTDGEGLRDHPSCGKREEEISPATNRMNARFMCIFSAIYYAFFFWLLYAWWRQAVAGERQQARYGAR
ncbi:MAG: hypothetical protein IPG74_05615 [Flavobacteriales bacterium]|nr:hypothetical protein [Flavobacteriales bacterium]